MTVSVVAVCYKDNVGHFHESKRAAIEADKHRYWWNFLGDNGSRTYLADQLAIGGLDKHVAALKALEKRYEDV